MLKQLVSGAGLITSLALAVPAHAALMTIASLDSFEPVAGTATPIQLQGIATPSATSFSGSGYSISFAGNGPNQGVVTGFTPNFHAIPIAGVAGNTPTYLTGDFGSATTADPSRAGNYLSTGGNGASITITFAVNQSAFGLLWGSADTFNTLQFYGANGSLIGTSPADNTVTGRDVQAAASGFTQDGSQAYGGSAYVTVESSLAFRSVVASSSTPSFEFTSGLGSTSETGLRQTAVPEPQSLALLGVGLIAVGLFRRNKA